MKDNDFIQSALPALKSCLEEVPFLEIEHMQVSTLDNGPGIIVKVRIQDEERNLFVEVKNNGQPRIARLATYQLKDYLRQSLNAYAIFVAPYISQEAGKICEESGIGYLDLAGNCLLRM